MEQEKEDYLLSKYTDAGSPASFSGPEKFYRYLKNENKYHFSRKDIKEWIRGVDSYTLNRQVRRKFRRNKVIAPYINYQWDIDTAHMASLGRFNSGYKYFILAIDICSRFIRVEAIKSPTAQGTYQALEKIFKESKPLKIRTDRGLEYMNKVVQNYFKQQGCEHFVSNSELKSSYAERGIKTIKSRLLRYLSNKDTKKWINILQDTVDSYNHSYHRSLGMRPADVKKTDQAGLWLRQFATEDHMPVQLYKFDIDDTLRISQLKTAFEREYSQHWTTEIFRVTDRRLVGAIANYTLKDIKGRIVKGIFYQEELQKVNGNVHFKVEKILKRNRGQALVKWEGWPDIFSSWIPMDRIKTGIYKSLTTEQ